MPPFNAIPWKALVESLAPDAKFGKPAVEAPLGNLEQALGVGVSLPDELRQLLRELMG